MADKGAVVITGASTGIGWTTAKLLMGRGFRVFGSVRKQADAERLSRELGESFTPLLMDVTDAAAVKAAADQVRAAIGDECLAGLVNNAGLGIAGPLLHLPADQMRFQMEVNLIGPMQVTQAFAGLLGAEPGRRGRRGRIVQMSSVAGKLALPFLGAYVASKHALEGMSDVLRRELMLYGIDVIVIGPGTVVTPIWDKAEAADLSQYGQTAFAKSMRQFGEYFISEGRKGLEPEKVAEVVYTTLTVSKPKVRYAVVRNRFRNWTLPRLLPSRKVDQAISKQLGLHP